MRFWATQFLFFAAPTRPRFFSIRFTQMIERQLKLGDVYADAGETARQLWRGVSFNAAGYIIESSFTPQFTMNLSLFPTAGLRHPPLLGIRLWPLAKYGYNDFVIIEKGAAAKDTSNLTRDKNLDPLP